MKLEFRLIVAFTLMLFIVSLFFLSHVYACLTIAFVLSYLLEPVVSVLEKKGMGRDYGVPVSLFIFFVILGAVGMIVAPRLLEQGRELIERVPVIYSSLAQSFGPTSEAYLGYNAFTEFDKVLAQIGQSNTLVSPLGGFVQGALTHTFKFVIAVLGLLIIPLMTFYLLREFPKIYGKLVYVIPARHHATVEMVRTRLDGVLGGFIRGQLVVSSILSLYYVSAFAVLKIKLALVLGLMAGFFNIIPYLGISTVLVLTLLVAFIHEGTMATYIGIGVVFAIGMVMEGSVLTPRIVGRKVGLSPLMLIISLMVGGELLGLVGMLLAVPLAAILKVLFGVILDRYRSSETFRRV